MTERGFSDVAVDSSHAFRALMQAMARPGCVQALDLDITPPPPLQASTASVALTLCDFQTPVWLAPGLRGDSVSHYLRFHTGAPVTGDLAKAQFVFVSVDDLPSHPAQLMQGTHEYPDRSTTLVIQVAGFGDGAVELSGPGLRGELNFGVQGLGQEFWRAMAENHARFPVGIDVIFAAPGEIAALPRSTAIRLLETV